MIMCFQTFDNPNVRCQVIKKWVHVGQVFNIWMSGTVMDIQGYLSLLTVELTINLSYALFKYTLFYKASAFLSQREYVYNFSNLSFTLCVYNMLETIETVFMVMTQLINIRGTNLHSPQCKFRNKQSLVSLKYSCTLKSHLSVKVHINYICRHNGLSSINRVTTRSLAVTQFVEFLKSSTVNG